MGPHPEFGEGLITVDFPKDSSIPREQMIETYINIAAQVFGRSVGSSLFLLNCDQIMATSNVICTVSEWIGHYFIN